jgi:hypothetical protein
MFPVMQFNNEDEEIGYALGKLAGNYFSANKAKPDDTISPKLTQNLLGNPSQIASNITGIKQPTGLLGGMVNMQAQNNMLGNPSQIASDITGIASPAAGLTPQAGATPYMTGLTPPRTGVTAPTSGGLFNIYWR